MRMASRSMAQPTAASSWALTLTARVTSPLLSRATSAGQLGHLTIATTPAGYRRLLEWARGLGSDPRFGVEGTGSYGAGLARFLIAAGCTVIEVNRPNRQTRYARGKSDPVDAEAAARAVLSGEATGLAKVDTDSIGMIRALRVARRSAVKMRTQTFQQMKALLVTAPAELREQLRLLSHDRLVDTAACLRPGPVTSVGAAVKLALKCLAQRHQLLTAELATLDRDLERLVATAAPTLCALKGVGTDVAGAVLVAAGDNPERLRSEGAFANLCGVAPLPASSGKTTGRHRLNRGGDRHANCALWRVVIVRLATHEQTRNYMAPRTQEGMSKPEIIRCLKRYVAREIYRELIPRAALAAVA